MAAVPIMSRRAALMGAGAAVLTLSHAEAAAGPRRAKDIIVVVLDDTGFSDFGCYGAEIRTPNIDALAQGGLRYTGFDTKAICSPTRAALLTGRNSHTVNMADLTESSFDAGELSGAHSGRLPANAQTVAQALRSAGYATAAIGKWHLAAESQDGAPGNNSELPLQRGFDYFYGFWGGWTDQYRPTLAEGNSPLPTPEDPGYHVSVDLVDRAIGRLDMARADEKPAFLYLSFGATHAPIQVPQAYIDRYAGVYDKGWDAIRQERFARQKQIGLIPPETVLPPPNPGDPAWDQLSATQKRVYARYMEAYAGFLEHADEQIGRLIAHLKATGRFDNSLIVLLSDNGPTGEAGQAGAFGRLYPPNQVPAEEVATRMEDIGKIHIGYQRPWAMAGATPFRRYKTWPLLGGVRTPLIIHWPGEVRDPGGFRRQAIDAIDIAPTLLEAAGARFAEKVDGVAQIPVAGRSILQTVRSPAAPDPRQVQYFELRGNRAIRQGHWRAVAVHRLGDDFAEDRWALYDLSTDLAEANDVAAQHPRKLAEMKALWTREARAFGALELTEGPAYVRRLDRYRDAFVDERW